MGKNTILTREQTEILDLISQNNFLNSKFYFTGGTALSEVYLQHRESVDLDLFSLKEFDPQIILQIFQDWSKKTQFLISSRFLDPVNIYILKFKNGNELKVDFAEYPYQHLNKTNIYKGLEVDSLFDIACNKLLALTQRTEVKDYVDLYFLMKQFNFWQLKDGVEAKFNLKIEPYLIAADFLAVEEFTILPNMIKPLNLSELREFFKTESKRLAKQQVE